jgi:hypothetical protein
MARWAIVPDWLRSHRHAGSRTASNEWLSRVLRGWRFPVGQLVLVCLVAVVVRVPFVSAGIGMDEGGYAYVAWRWMHGARLYNDAWIDRPQALILLYRAILTASPSIEAIRITALACGVAISLLLLILGRCLWGPTAGLTAGLLYALIGVSPGIDGFTLNAELPAATAVSCAAVCVSLGMRRDTAIGWGAAGFFAAIALLCKQTAVDGMALVATTAWLAARGRRRRWLAWSSAGFGLVALPALAWGVSNGTGAYWDAMLGYKLTGATGGGRTLAERIGSFYGSLQSLADTALLAGLAGIGVFVSVLMWRGDRQRNALPLVWVCAAVVGVNVGGRYWPHYYMQLVPPLCRLGGIAVAWLRERSGLLAWSAVAFVATPIAWTLVDLESLNQTAFARAVPYVARSQIDRQLARQIDSRTRPGARLLTIGAEPDLYFLARRRSAFRYLWGAQLEDLGSAKAAFRAQFVNRPPAAVVVYERPAWLFADGLVGHILRTRYRRVWCPFVLEKERCLFILRKTARTPGR